MGAGTAALLGALVAYLGGARAAGVEDVVTGEFAADYDGGSEYYYADPYEDTLPPLGVETTVNMTCKATRSRRFELPYRGVSLGGWMVLEPWLTPSLFYQFLGTPDVWGNDAPKHTAVDMYSFCAVLGPEEANRQLRRHWQSWLTEGDFKKLRELRINALRIPVGDWMWKPYGPYANCTDGALAELDRALSLARKYGMRVLLDMHGVRGSQNGFDNSGRMTDIQWTLVPGMLAPGSTAPQPTFSHWAEQSPKWIGDFDRKRWTTVSINWANVDWAVHTLCLIAEMYGSHPAVFGLQLLNEPWQYTPIGPLKRFYWEAYKAVRRRAPTWKVVLSDSFRPRVELWAPFMTGCPGVVLSTHLHQAWMPAAPLLNFLISACDSKRMVAALHEEAMDVIVGEWSLATDNCAMWLNGFNDNLPGYPVVECAYAPCAQPYMGPEQPGAPVDATRAEQGPFGTGMSTPRYGQCPVDRPWPDDDEATRRLALKKLNAFQGVSGWFFWNFKTELPSKWDYVKAVDNGWIPRDPTAWDEAVETACNLEDRNGFSCVLKHGASPALVAKGVHFACNQTGMAVPYCEQPEPDRLAQASKVFTQYWRIHHRSGGLCDFDGVAQLLPDFSYGQDPSSAPIRPAAGARGGAPQLPARLERSGPHAATTRAPLLLAGGLAAVAMAAVLVVVRRARRAAQEERGLREPLATGGGLGAGGAGPGATDE